MTKRSNLNLGYSNKKQIKKISLSIIIPCFNEDSRIQNTLKEIDNFFFESNKTIEIIIVDDGSDDNLTTVVENLDINNIKVLRNDKNRGKGYSVCKGVSIATGDFCLICDADNSTPISEFNILFDAIKNHDNSISIGSRYLSNSNVVIKQPFYRIFMGRIGNIAIEYILGLKLLDTQCGFKLFHTKNAKEIFNKVTINRFGYDFEMLFICKNLGIEVIELPVTWLDTKNSRLRPFRDSIGTFVELIKVKLNSSKGFYK